MIPSFPYFLVGYCTLSTDQCHAASLLELCRLHALSYRDFTTGVDGDVSFRLPSPVARRLRRLCQDREIPLRVSGEGGLPRLVGDLLRRPGLVAGGVLSLALYLLSQGLLWDVRIQGNQRVSDHAVRESLAACGLRVGMWLSELDTDVLENQVLLYDRRLAWLSINRKGTVAYVEVREAVTPPRPEETYPRDLVASRGGVIAHIELETGNVLVKAGQTVSEGQVLVSGLFDSERMGWRLVRAEARIFAKTVRDFSVTIPLRYSQKTYISAPEGKEGEAWQEKTVIFFGRHIKFSKKCRNLSDNCDIMIDERSWGSFGDVGFPISTRIVYHLPYEITPALRTYAQAEELAYLRLAEYISAIEGGTLLEKTVTITRAEEFLTLSCRLSLLEDIGKERILEVVP